MSETHIWGIVETHGDVISCAYDYLSDKIVSAQRHFLNEVSVTETEAFKQYNFATPEFRGFSIFLIREA